MFTKSFIALGLFVAFSSTIACAAVTTTGTSKASSGVEAKQNVAPRDGALVRAPKGKFIY